MADDWKAGDDALCVTDHIDGFGTCKIVRIGCIYKVEDVYFGTEGKYAGVVALVLRGVRGNRWPGLHSGLFRKMLDHTPDEFDRETIDLMNGAPVGEPAA
jgi:hypothetical protein